MDIYKLVNNVPIFSDYIKSDEEIDKETLKKIRAKYSEADEMKLHRQKLNNENLDSYNEYNLFVESCRLDGQNIKQANQERIKQLTPYVIEDRTIMVEYE